MPVFSISVYLFLSLCSCFYLLSIRLYLILSLCQSRPYKIQVLVNIGSNTFLRISNRNPFLSLSISCLFPSISLYLFVIQIHAYLFPPLSILMVRSSNYVYAVYLITNNYFYLLNQKEIENNTANIQGIDLNREKVIQR